MHETNDDENKPDLSRIEEGLGQAYNELHESDLEHVSLKGMKRHIAKALQALGAYAAYLQDQKKQEGA